MFNFASESRLLPTVYRQLLSYLQIQPLRISLAAAH